MGVNSIPKFVNGIGIGIDGIVPMTAGYRHEDLTVFELRGFFSSFSATTSRPFGKVTIPLENSNSLMSWSKGQHSTVACLEFGAFCE